MWTFLTMGKWSRRAFITTGVVAGGAVVFGVAIRRGNPVDKVASFMAGEDETLLNVWLKISADNSITVIAPHAEMGQGVHTTLAMMLADELDADWEMVKMLEAPAHEEYANYALRRGYSAGDIEFPAFLIDTVNGHFLDKAKSSGSQVTGGSTSVRYTGELAMRVAGASAKAVLLQAAADAWNVETGSLRAEKSHIIHDATGRRAPFAEFTAAAENLSQSPVPVLKSPDQFTIMGTAVPRIDVPVKVDGSARFGIDVVLPDMKYATVKAAPVFGSKITGINESSVQGMPGVRKIVNLDNAVAIVADGYWQARQAMEYLDIKWSQSGHEAREQGDIFRQFADALDAANANDANQPDVEIGDTAGAFAAASQVVDAEYRVPFLAHATMEPMNCTAWIHEGQCELWLGTQNPLGFKMRVARAIGFEPEQVILHNQYLGGGFGRRAVSDYAEQAARIALEVPYPVKLIWSREEDMRHDRYRQASISRFSGALDAVGRPIGWRNQYVEKHVPVEAPHVPYAIDNQLIHSTESRTHVPWGYWRSVDHSLHSFFTESFIDELAVAAGKDSFEYRRDLLADKPGFLSVLERVAEESGWGGSLPENYGRGIAICRSFGTIVAQVVEVEVNDSKVRAHRVVCAVDAGFAMHPDGMKAQMDSGIIYGLTAALYGDISIHHGAVAQSNFHDYQMLRMNEAPDIETHIINSGGRTGGAGEAGTPAIAPALANAIFDATGRRIRELPIKNFDFSNENSEPKVIV
jgi:isoquinoline 1-oxidoreductase beta subunit